MSYSEKLLREFVRNSLNDLVLSEIVTGDEGTGSSVGKEAWGTEAAQSPKVPGFKDRWCYGRSADGCEQAGGIWGLLGLPKSDLWGSIFGDYTCGDSIVSDTGTTRGTCEGIFKSLWTAVSAPGKAFLDLLFNTAGPTPVSETAADFGKNFFPHTRAWVTSGGSSIVPRGPTPRPTMSSPTLSRVTSPTPPPITEIHFKTLFEMSLLLEQDAEAAAGLEKAVTDDLSNIVGAVDGIKGSGSIIDAVRGWLNLLGERKNLGDLASAFGTLTAEDNKSFDGEGGIVKIFVDKIVSPFISQLLTRMSGDLINKAGLPAGTEAILKAAFDSALSKIY